MREEYGNRYLCIIVWLDVNRVFFGAVSTPKKLRIALGDMDNLGQGVI